MVPIAIVNAAIRESVYRRFTGELAAHQLSTASGIVLFGIYIWLVTGRWRIESGGRAVAIGTLWLAMTVAFEFLFGHFVVGHPWSRLLHDYNLIAGRLWVLVLVWVAVAPYVMFRLRAFRSR
jgi:hypothetical protein